MTMRRTDLILSLALLAVVTVPAGAQTVRELTPEESVRLGLEHSPLLRAARSDADAASAALAQARSDRLPTISTQAGYTRLSGNVPDVTFTVPGTDSTVTFQSIELDRYQAEISVQQPLFTGSRLSSQVRSAEHGARAADLREDQQRSDVAFDIRRAYWNLYRALATRDALADALQRVEAHLAVVRAKVDEGAVLRRDLLAAQTRRSEVELDRVEADNGVQVSQLELNRLIGLPLDTPVRPATDVQVDTSALSLADLPDSALARTPRLAALMEDAGGLDAQVRASEARHWPEVDFVGRYIYARPNQYFFLEQDRFRHSWELGLSARWDAWDGGRRSASTGALRAQLDASRARLDDARAQVTVAAERQRLEVVRAREAMRVTAQAVEEAAETFRVAQRQFQEGAALPTDVLDAEEAYRNAEERHAGALADFAIARAAVINTFGRVW
jgi:outer membrane protein